MLLNTIAEKHLNSFVLLLPKTRDEQNRVRDWDVLNTSRHSDIDFVEQKLTVRRQLGRDIKKNDSELDAKTYTKQEIATKKPSSVRTIDIPDIVYDAILEQRKWYEASKSRRSKYFLDLDYVCCSSYGRPRSKNFHFQHFKKLLKDLDLPDVRWHDLRGTCATILLLNGMSPKAIAENLGHA